MRRIWLLAAGVMVVLAELCASALAETRIALVIGNSEYVELGRLNNPVNDMLLMTEALGSVGFEVIAQAEADQAAMKRAIQDFGQRLEEAGRDAVGLFYYAGHGIQVNGTNYMIPLHARISREPDVEIEAVKLDWVLEQMEHARNRMNILILDACRNNPLSRSFRSSEQGLSRIDAPRGTLIAYATAPGRVSFDGDGPNSPYTEALAATIAEPGLDVEIAFRQVRVKVMEATGDRQIPWESSSLTGAFHFNPGVEPEVTGPSEAVVSLSPSSGSTVAPPSPLLDRTSPAETARVQDLAGEAELLFWDSIKATDNPRLYREYLRRFPDGVFAPIAMERLEAPTGAAASPDRERPSGPEVTAEPPAQSRTEPEPERIALVPAVVAPAPFEASQLTGRWEGKYQCQGEAVGMALEVPPLQGDRVAARFEFFPADGAPSFPTGSFQVDGIFELDSRRLRLTAGDWIDRPWGFQRHDLVGVVQDDGITIAGRVLTAGCKDFKVQRRSGRS